MDRTADYVGLIKQAITEIMEEMPPDEEVKTEFFLTKKESITKSCRLAGGMNAGCMERSSIAT